MNSIITSKRYLDMKLLVDYSQDGGNSVFGVQRRKT